MIEEYNYNDNESGRTETLIKSLEKVEKLQKKLDIAIDALSYLEENTTEPFDVRGLYLLHDTASSALKEIKKQKGMDR